MDEHDNEDEEYTDIDIFPSRIESTTRADESGNLHAVPSASPVRERTTDGRWQRMDIYKRCQLAIVSVRRCYDVSPMSLVPVRCGLRRWCRCGRRLCCLRGRGVGIIVLIEEVSADGGDGDRDRHRIRITRRDRLIRI